MGQRKHGEPTQAVLYKSLAQQRTKKGTNTCLIISPLILCGLLFGLQLAINYLFLDRPEFKVRRLAFPPSASLDDSRAVVSFRPFPRRRRPPPPVPIPVRVQMRGLLHIHGPERSGGVLPERPRQVSRGGPVHAEG